MKTLKQICNETIAACAGVPKWMACKNTWNNWEEGSHAQDRMYHTIMNEKREYDLHRSVGTD